ncbi:peptide deformylase [Pleionea sediminis]|uniref:peptide deformylase n=1 Tax=Pleionea sediminis TaxID=2569479 RepID=UPI0011847BF0|nr:peptide deformylase [Pleionea sediminis]
MTARTLLKMGHPLLLQQAEAVVEFNSPELDDLILDMYDTMRENNGAGLAAPQIGVSKQVVIFSVDGNPRYPDVEPVPDTVLINPKIEILDESTESDWEGCLSIPGMRGLVARPKKIQYSGFNQKGESFSVEAEGFHARVVQHEVDHLLGILYPYRIKDLRYFGFEDELFRSDQS